MATKTRGVKKLIRTTVALKDVKHVTISLRMDSYFVGMLRATVGLKGLGPDLDRQHTALEVLGVVALAEARGALEEQVHILTPPEWRPHLEAVHEARKVEVG